MRYLILFLLLIMTNIYASPTIYGPTGLVEMPSAESIAYKQINFGIDYSVYNSKDSSENQVYYKFNLGSFENWELGVLGGSFIDEGVFVNLKYFLMTDQQENPLSIAVGVERVGSNSDLASYLVSSKRLDDGLNLHFGFKAFLQDGLIAGAMLGGEYFTSDKMAFITDIIGEKNQSYVVNTGFRFYIENNITFRFYLMDLTKTKENKETIYSFGLSFDRYI